MNLSQSENEEKTVSIKKYDWGKSKTKVSKSEFVDAYLKWTVADFISFPLTCVVASIFVKCVVR